MVYKWKTGAVIGISAQIAGEECERLAAEGRLTAKDLLDDNRPKDAPLHKAFEWDDAIAAEKYRTDQAAHIIRSVVVVPETEDREPTRAFFTVERKVYEPVKIVISDDRKRAKLLEIAYKELTAFRRKYKSLSQLTPIFDAIDEVAKQWKMQEKSTRPAL